MCERKVFGPKSLRYFIISSVSEKTEEGLLMMRRFTVLALIVIAALVGMRQANASSIELSAVDPTIGTVVLTFPL